MEKQKTDIFEVMDILKRLAETSTDSEAVSKAKEIIKSFEETQEKQPKSLIKIDHTASCNWLYGRDEMWKDYVYENFDEIFVLFGNRNCVKIAEASWYLKANELLSELKSYEESNIDYKQYGLSKVQFEEIVNFFEENNSLHSLVHIIEIMNPDDTFKLATIHGYSQSDWQEVLYKSTNMPEDILEPLTDFYFGQIAEVFVENGDDSFTDVIANNKLWQIEKEGKLKEYFCEMYELDLENTAFLESDGQYNVTRFKEF